MWVLNQDSRNQCNYLATPGRKDSWNEKLLEFIIESLASGESAAATHRFLSRIAKFYPDTIAGNNKLPSADFIESLRISIGFLNRAHSKSEIENADRVFIVSDAAAMLDRTSVITTGFYFILLLHQIFKAFWAQVAPFIYWACRRSKARPDLPLLTSCSSRSPKPA